MITKASFPIRRFAALAILFGGTPEILFADTPAVFEPFAPAITAYNVADPLIGQTNAAGLSWVAAGSGANTSFINSGNLSVTGLEPATGNMLTFGVSDGPSTRIKLPNATNAGTMFYSFAFRVDALGTLNTNGGFFASFNNGTASQTNTPTVVAACTQTRLATNGPGFNVGLKKGSGGSVFDTNVFQVGDTIFVVASYTFNTGTTTDDEADMWINPDPASFGSASAPPPTLSTNATADYANSIASFVFFRRGSGNGGLEPLSLSADELRVGLTWASVTPTPTVAAPALSVSLSSPNVVLTWPMTFTGYRLQGAPSLISGSNAWTNVTAPVDIVGTNNSVSDPLAGKNYYRLISP